VQASSGFNLSADKLGKLSMKRERPQKPHHESGGQRPPGTAQGIGQGSTSETVPPGQRGELVERFTDFR
jgi:hypothetical protein